MQSCYVLAAAWIFTSAAWASPTCSLAGFSGSSGRAARDACEISMKAADCEKAAESDSALRENFRNCASEGGARELIDTFVGCDQASGEIVKDAVRSLAKGVASFYNVFAEDSAARNRAIDTCYPDENCRNKIFSDAGAAPSAAGDRDAFAKIWQQAQRKYSIDKVEQQRNAISLQRDLITQGLRPGTAAYDEALSRATPETAEYQKNATDKNPHPPTPLKDLVLAKARQLYTHSQCLDQRAASELICYSVFSIVSPSAAAGALAKLPRLSRLLGKGTSAVARAVRAETAAVGNIEAGATKAATRDVVGANAELETPSPISRESSTSNRAVAAARSDSAATIQSRIESSAAQLTVKERSELRSFIEEATDPKSGEFRLSDRQVTESQSRRRVYTHEPVQVNEKGGLSSPSAQEYLVFEGVLSRIEPYRSMSQFDRDAAVYKLLGECK